ncbi:hypothetical protein LEP1GSC193_2510 [Leptospira alstonii serovar Pingchang str. 80-412]|uniref:Uncharacterized protein n=1 Tax=Leptospira alstonii serovar Pingchang str. 80-412 TaxID=1218564 RepID=T0FTW2_9LEPT|nr:hypothetical protein LEP1GSC193_2510 [Leptospira alstonii serovar Pingchang str. 80-412]
MSVNVGSTVESLGESGSWLCQAPDRAFCFDQQIDGLLEKRNLSTFQFVDLASIAFALITPNSR